MNWILVGIFCYLAIQFSIGLWVSRRIKNETDYIVAGRSLGLGLAAFSIFATWFGAESIQGAAGLVYSDGLSGGSYDPFGYVMCILGMGLFFARPLWNRGFTTFGDLFRQRYSPGVERFAILLIVPTSIFWGAAQIRAFGNVVSHASSIPLIWSITGAAVFVMVYTSVGGLLADAWTDLVQGIALLIGLVSLTVVMLVSGELQTAWGQIPEERMLFLGGGDIPWYEVLETWIVPIIGSMLAIEIISRVLGCRSADTARRACLIGGSMYLIVGLIPVVLGLCGPLLVPGLEDPEQLIPALAEAHLGTFLYVLFAGALLSAILSTVDSNLLAGSSLLTHNLFLKLKPDLSDLWKLRCSRLGVLFLGVVAYVLAIGSESIKDLVTTSSAFGSAGIFVVGCFGLFSRVGGTLSAYSSLFTGIVVWVSGEYYFDWPTPYMIALGASFAAYLVTAPFSPGTALPPMQTPGEQAAATV